MNIAQSSIDSTCDIQFAIYVFNVTSNVWVDAGTSNTVYDFIHTFEASSGTLQVNSTDIAKYGPETAFLMKITATSKETMDQISGRVAEMEFTLTLQNKCYHNQLTLDQDLNDAVYHINHTGTMTITPVYTNSVSGCTAVKKLYFFDTVSSLWIECDAACVAGTS